MKKIKLAASLAALGIAFTSFTAHKTSSDGTFEGIVTYSVTVDNPQYASMMQDSYAKVYIKGSKSKTIMETMSKTMIFTDQNTPDNPVVLVEAMDTKYQLKMDSAMKNRKPAVINYMDETKTIAGYTCHKAQVTTTGYQGGQTTQDVYYTTDIVSYPETYGQLKGLKGFPLQFSINQGGMNFALMATGVKKQSLSDDIFKVPSGYKLMTMAEMMQDIMKNRNGGGN